MHKELVVSLGERSYPIFIGENLFESDEYLSRYCSDQVLIVTNTTVAALYSEQLNNVVTKFAKKSDTIVLRDGEQYKNLTTIDLIITRLLEGAYNRKATLIALGGGVVGDMTGFAAACYQRGVNFVQIPTTLLSQVDSSVGGKTGVNHPLGKNMIGAFYQPNAVVIDLGMLASLPSRELSAGLAEVIKYGLIADLPFFEWLEAHISSLMAGENEALSYAIERSCRIKSDIVAKDEREGGIRAILNFGHTFGHAIETAQGYGNWLHGEAVGLGMLMACDLSVRLGWLSQDIYNRAKSLIQAAGLPICAPEGMPPSEFMHHMAVDKKNLDGDLRLVLLNQCGEAIVTAEFEHALLNDTLVTFCGH